MLLCYSSTLEENCSEIETAEHEKLSGESEVKVNISFVFSNVTDTPKFLLFICFQFVYYFLCTCF